MATGTSGRDTLFGTDQNDQLFGLEGDDTFIGSGGNDFFDGGTGFNTADYSGLNVQITLSPMGVLNKGSLGTDNLFKIQRIVGSNNFNIIDASTVMDGASLEVDLGRQSLIVRNVPNIGTLSLSVAQFNWVIGTPNADRLVGTAFSDLLRGIGGNDTILGGDRGDILIGDGGSDTVNGQAGGDRLLGTDNTTRGRDEVDAVTGGSGNDEFVMGSRLGTFYNFSGSRDFARITDFAAGDVFQLGINQTYRAERTDRGFNLLVIQNGVRDLIAQVTASTAVTLPSGNFTITATQGTGIFQPSNSF